MKFIKIVCMIISLSLASSLFAVQASFELDSGVTTVKIQDTYMKLLEKINVLDPNDDIDANETITRAYFVALVSRALRLSLDDTNVNTMFHDVPLNHKYASEIAVMYQVGYIKGDERRNFRPDDVITQHEALAILVSCLGYMQHAEAKGGYPIGYILEANSLRLIEGIETHEVLTQQESTRLIFNALEANSAQINGVSGTDILYTTADNLLARIHSIYRVDGIVSSNSVTGLSSENVNRKYITINGIDIEIENTIDALGLIGLHTRIYYLEDDGVNKYVMTSDTSKNEVFALSGWKDDIRYDRTANLIYYTTDTESIKTAKLDNSFKLIYNGKAEENHITYLANLSNAFVRLIDNNRDGLFDVVVVFESTNIVVDLINIETETIRDMYDVQKILKLSDFDRYDIYSSDGSPFTINNVVRWNVLSCYISADRSYSFITVNTGSMNGEITEISYNDGISYVIGGKTFETVPSFESADINLEIGNAGTFYFDASGRIAAYSKDTNNGIAYGVILLKAAKKTNLDAPIQIKLLGSTVGVQVLNIAKNIKIDNVSYVKKSADEILGIINSRIDKNNLDANVIAYSLNENLEINMIDFAQTTLPKQNDGANDNGLYMYKPNPGDTATKTQVPYHSGVFGDKFLINNATIVLGIDAKVKTVSTNEDDQYFLASKSIFRNEVGYRVVGYAMGANPMYADVILYYGEKLYRNYTPFAIQKLITTTDENGEIYYKAPGIGTGGSTEVKIRAALVKSKNLVAGDVFSTFDTDHLGYVYDCAIAFKYDEKRMITNNADWSFYSQHRTYMIYPYDVSGVSLKHAITTTPEAAVQIFSDPNLTEAMLNQKSISTANIYISMPSNNGLIYRQASLADITTYRNSNAKFSKILLYTNYAEPKLVIIYDY